MEKLGVLWVLVGFVLFFYFLFGCLFLLLVFFFFNISTVLPVVLISQLYFRYIFCALFLIPGSSPFLPPSFLKCSH